MSDHPNLQENQVDQNAESEFVEYVIHILKAWKGILGATGLFVLAAIGGSYLIPNTYTGIAKILPPQSSQSSSVNAVVLAQLGGLANMAGGSLGARDPNALYITMLKSRRVTEKLVYRFDLQKIYKTRTLTDAVAVLGGFTNIYTSKDGVIAVEVEDKSPQRAAELANAYVDELNKLLQTLALSEAAQRRKYFENQLKPAKERLINAEILLDRTPSTSLQYMEARRNLKFEESVYEILIKQFEIAKLDESKDAPLIQVLDKAETPEKKSKPKRTMIVLLVGILGLIFSIAIVVIRKIVLSKNLIRQFRQRLAT